MNVDATSRNCTTAHTLFHVFNLFARHEVRHTGHDVTREGARAAASLSVGNPVLDSFLVVVFQVDDLREVVFDELHQFLALEWPRRMRVEIGQVLEAVKREEGYRRSSSLL